MAAQPDMTDVFQFMEVRPPFSPEVKSLRLNYIRDDFVGLRGDKPDRIETDLQTVSSPSTIGRLVYEHVFCADGADNPDEDPNTLIDAVLALLAPYQPLCPAPTPPTPSSTTAIRELSITELERRAYVREG